MTDDEIREYLTPVIEHLRACDDIEDTDYAVRVMNVVAELASERAS